MLGAIIGDLAGSIYEYDQIKEVKGIKIDRIIDNKAFFSDDTIMTIAIADAILHNKDYAETMKYYVKKWNSKIPTNIPYFSTMFSPTFAEWAFTKVGGESIGNGAMMRISPVGYLFDNEDEVKENVRLATIPSHNTQSAIKCAEIVALIIFYSRQGLTKEKIISKLNLKITKPLVNKFNYTCADTIDVCLYSLFTANSFEESIKIALSFGGDTDTNACIVGSMAEAMYGIDERLKKEALAKLPKEFIEILNKCYSKIEKLKIT